MPLVVENVCGAQPWVGPARWRYGSFFLWGDVPALMPIVRKHAKVGDWFGPGCESPMRHGHSKSSKRKAASALIAKIPFDLAHWIGRAWLPRKEAAA